MHKSLETCTPNSYIFSIGSRLASNRYSFYNDYDEYLTTSVNDVVVPFTFRYQDGSYGYLNENGEFVNFSSGGTDVSDTTATAGTVLSGYQFHLANGDLETGTYIPLDTSDATAKAKNIEEGYTAYVNGVKITGTAYIEHELKYYGAVSLSTARYYILTANVGNYVLFGGGIAGSNTISVVEAFDINLSKRSATSFSIAKSTNAGSASIGNYALFAGGYYASGTYECTNMVEAYNDNLSKSTPPVLSQERMNVAGTQNANYAIFACGRYQYGANTYYTNRVDAYDVNLTRSTLNFTNDGTFGVHTYMGKYAIFGQFNNNVGSYKTMYLYDDTLTLSTGPSSSQIGGGCHVSNNKYLLLTDFQLQSSPYYTNLVEAYNSNLTRFNVAGLTEAKSQPAGSYINDYILFGGGTLKVDSSISKTVEVYDKNMVKKVTTDLSTARYWLNGAQNSKYALIAGGYIGNNVCENTVDVYYET